MSVDFEGLFESFVAESSEMLDRAEGSVLELEKGFNKEVVNDIFRAFHTIKGDSGIFGLQEITDTAHALENMLDLMRAEKLEVSMERIDLLLTGIDRLRQMIAAARVGPGGVQLSSDGDVKTLLDTLHKAIAGDRQVPVKKPQTIVRQNSVGEGGSFSLRVPKRYRLDAEARGHYLSLVYVDLYAQGISSLLEIRQILDNLEDQGSLLMQGVLENMLPGRGPGADGSLLPYYMVLATQGPVEPFLEHHGIGGKVLRVLHTPKGQNAVPVGGAAVPVDLVEDDAGVSGEAGTGGATPAVPAPLLAGENAIRDDRNAEEGVLLDEGRGTAGMIVKMPAKKTKQSAVEAPPSAMPPAEPKESPSLKNANQAIQSMRESSSETHLKVSVTLLDELINLAGETIIARNDLMQKVERIKDPALAVTSKKVSYLVTKLQESIMRTRLQEIGTIFQRLPRLVRDISLLTGKQVELVTEGGDVELDKTLIDAIVDPVMHMVRNSIDHGIEAPEIRIRAGKPEKGILKLSATLRGGNVILRIIDDGKGLDADAIRNKALAKGLITERQAAEATNEELFELIFEPGFSTAETITQTSGRGVGMDVVRTNFKRVGGTVDVSSEKGRGTTITATLPQTLSIITCLMVEIAAKRYAMPQQNIEELILIDPEQLTTVESHIMYRLRGHLLPLVKIGEVLYPGRQAEQEPRYIAVVRSDRHRFGMMIDDIINPEEIVVKPLGEHFSDLTIFSGAAILGDGEAVLILDIPGVARFTNLQSNMREDLEASRDQAAADEKESGYLLVGVAGNQFAMPVSSVPRIEKITSERIESFMGIETLIFNDEIVPLLRLQTVYRLARREAVGTDLYVLIFNVHGMRVGIVVDSIKSVVGSIGHVETGAYLGESVNGQAIVNGEKTVVLDVIDLIGRMQQTKFRELRAYIEKGAPDSASAMETTEA